MTKGYYNEAAVRQQERVAQSKDMAAQRALVRRLLALRRGESVLDVGSGNGILARELVDDVGGAGCVVGVDPARTMVAMAQLVCPEASFLQGGAEALPVAGGAFDAVTANQVLCFVADIDTALNEMFRVLKPGGRVVILDTDWDSLVWNCRDRALLRRVVAELTKPYRSAFVPRSLSRRLMAAGFTVTERRVHTVVNWDDGAASYSQQLVGFIALSTGSDAALSRADRDAWAGEMRAAAAAGEYLFSLNRYVFCADKN